MKMTVIEIEASKRREWNNVSFKYIEAVLRGKSCGTETPDTQMSRDLHVVVPGTKRRYLKVLLRLGNINVHYKMFFRWPLSMKHRNPFFSVKWKMARPVFGI